MYIIIISATLLLALPIFAKCRALLIMHEHHNDVINVGVSTGCVASQFSGSLSQVMDRALSALASHSLYSPTTHPPSFPAPPTCHAYQRETQWSLTCKE